MGPVLIIILINDIDCNISNRILKFADDTKLFSCIGEDDVIERWRTNLKRLCEWSEDKLMLFIIDILGTTK